jgi:hypothetical protein
VVVAHNRQATARVQLDRGGTYRALRLPQRSGAEQQKNGACGACASTGTLQSVVSAPGATLLSRGRPTSSNTSIMKA